MIDHRRLYVRLLGSAFERLPSALRTFHGADRCLAAEGTLSVRRGPGPVRSALATLLRLPSAGESVLVGVRVYTDGGCEVWERTFVGARLISRQWAHAGLLVEQAGPARFAYRLSAGANGLRFAFARGWLFGIRLPSRCAVRVDARADSAGDNSWHLHVSVVAPIVGELVRYGGLVRLRSR